MRIIWTGDGKQCERLGAYMTVEAAMIIPLVICAIMFTVLITVFQYNRCLLEQDVGMVALYGMASDEGEGELLRASIEWKLATLYRDKYICWHPEELTVAMKGNSLVVSGEGRLAEDYSEWNFLNINNRWCARVRREISRLSPRTYLRLRDRIGGE